LGLPAHFHPNKPTQNFQSGLDARMFRSKTITCQSCISEFDFPYKMPQLQRRAAEILAFDIWFRFRILRNHSKRFEGQSPQ
jgi:hypothetical protein